MNRTYRENAEALRYTQTTDGTAAGRHLGLPELPSLEEQVDALFDELGQRTGWLLIYDNASKPASLEGLRPPAGGGHLLITSRNPAWRGVATSLSIDVLPRSQAVAFLRQRGGLDEPAAAALAEALGDLPLALEQAAAYLEATSTSPSEYLDLLRDRAGELFALGVAANSQQMIATTWTLSLRRVAQESSAAEDLLTLCAFLAPDSIPRSLLTDHPDVLPKSLATAVRDRLAFQQALGALRRYSLVAVTDKTVSMHRLVQRVTRDALTTNGQHNGAVVALRLVLASFPEDTEDSDQWPLAAELLAHVSAYTFTCRLAYGFTCRSAEGERPRSPVVRAILRSEGTNLPSRRMAAHDPLAGAMDGTARVQGAGRGRGHLGRDRPGDWL